MRHGMRVYAMGQAWWQGAQGHYWGHNAIVRVSAFRDHGTMPVIPGKPPVGGQIISHDLVEATLLAKAGYGVWVLPEEGGSYEENPPTYPDYIKRDLRWCQGNMQYLGLIGLKTFSATAMGWVKLAHAILMYMTVPCWLGFMALGFAQGIYMTASSADTSMVGPLTNVSLTAGIALFCTMIFLAFAPKLVGLFETLSRRETRAAYGGTGMILLGGVAEFVFSSLMAPVVAMAIVVFMGKLLLGRKVGWDAQERDSHTVPLSQAARLLWLQTVVGAVLAVGLIATIPAAARGPHRSSVDC